MAAAMLGRRLVVPRHHRTVPSALLASSSGSSCWAHPHRPSWLQQQHRRCTHTVAAAAAGDGDAADAAKPAAASEAAPAAATASSDSSPSSSAAAAARELVEGLPKAYVSEDEWREMDKKVNKYPAQRTFTAIGTGGDDFAAAMQAAVAGVVGTVHVECVSQRASSGGKYTSVRVGPVWVESAEQVISVFQRMREDPRLKWYM